MPSGLLDVIYDAQFVRRQKPFKHESFVCWWFVVFEIREMVPAGVVTSYNMHQC